MIAPSYVFEFAINDNYQMHAELGAVLLIVMGSYGLLSGVVTATARFAGITFLLFGLATLPFLAMDYYFYVVIPIFNDFILIDFALKLVMICICIWGYQRATAPAGEPG